MFQPIFLHAAMNELKIFIVTLLSGFASFIHPITNNMQVIMVLLGVNFLVGLMASIIVHHESFSWKKAGWCAIELIIMLFIVMLIYLIGKLQGNEPQAKWCVTMSVYAMIYFYSVRILRNLRSILLKGSVSYYVVDFLYSALSLELAKKIPGVQAYMEKHKEDKEFSDIIIPDEIATEA